MTPDLSYYWKGGKSSARITNEMKKKKKCEAGPPGGLLWLPLNVNRVGSGFRIPCGRTVGSKYSKKKGGSTAERAKSTAAWVGTTRCESTREEIRRSWNLPTIKLGHLLAVVGRGEKSLPGDPGSELCLRGKKEK